MRQITWLAVVLALTTGFASSGYSAQPSIDLTRVGADRLVGRPWLTLRQTLLCFPERTVEWTTDDAVSFGHSEILRQLFRSEMTAAQFRIAGASTDLFESKTENADLQLGALITSLKVDLCVLGSEESHYEKGSAVMDVEWQVYSVSQGKILARIPIQSELKVGLSSDGRLKLLRGVFGENVRTLAKSAEFEEIMRGQPAGEAHAQTASPQSEIRIAMVGATRPMPLALAAKGVVSIFAADGMGSGVLISPDGYLLTNHHVAGDAGRLRIRWPDGTDTVGEVIRADKRRDVALVKTTPPKVEPLAIRHGEVQLGETVYAIGTPREREFAGTLTRGVVSTVNRVIEGQSYIQSDVAITHGNSGGPLLDEKGWIVGLSQSTYEPDGVSQNINFFVPIDEALRALALKPAP